MNDRSRRGPMVLVLALALTATACSSGGPDRTTVLVFAAASLSDSFAELADEFEAVNPDIDVELNIGGSSALREQILNGAPADVVALASETVMADLVEAGEVSSPRSFTTNHLVIAVPEGNPGDVQTLADLERADLLVGLCAVGVPCGDLARTILDAAGVVAAVDTNEPDVRALTTKIAAGELDVGLVYITDAAGTGGVETVSADETDDAVTVYPIAQTDPADVAARLFVDFVLSPQGQSTLTDHGFVAP